MTLPNTERGLEAAGFVYENSAKCRFCDTEVAWYRKPEGGRIALEEGTLEPHWGKCTQGAGRG